MSSPAPKPASALWQWAVICTLILGAMAFAVAHAPRTWQRPGTTAFWFAVVGGVFIGGVAVLRVSNRRLIFGVAFGLITLSLAGMTAERYRLYVEALEEEYLGSLKPRTAAELGPAVQYGSAWEKLMDDIRAERQKAFEAKRPFPVFLEFRLQALGITTKPWPVVFFLAECLLGGLIGAIIAVRWHIWQTESASPTAG